MSRPLVGNRRFTYAQFHSATSVVVSAEEAQVDSVVSLLDIGNFNENLSDLVRKFELAGILYSSFFVTTQFAESSVPPLITLAYAQVCDSVYIERIDRDQVNIPDRVPPDLLASTTVGYTRETSDVILPPRILYRSYDAVWVGEPHLETAAGLIKTRTPLRRIRCKGALDEKDGIFASCSIANPTLSDITVAWAISGAIYFRVKT